MNQIHANSKKSHDYHKLVGKVFGYLIVIFVCGFVIYGLIDEERDNAKREKANITQMKALGINEDCNVLISDSINTTTKMNGSFILFYGSITSEDQDNIRIGYNAKNGESYIVNIPIRKIVFKRSNELKPSAKIIADRWNVDYDFQGNLEKIIQRVEITLTYDMYEQLLKK